MDALAVAVLDMAVQNLLSGVPAEIGFEQAGRRPPLGVDLEKTA